MKREERKNEKSELVKLLEGKQLLWSLGEIASVFGVSYHTAQRRMEHWQTVEGIRPSGRGTGKRYWYADVADAFYQA